MMDEGRWVDNVTSLPFTVEDAVYGAELAAQDTATEPDTVVTRTDTIPEVTNGGLDIHSVNQRLYARGMRGTSPTMHCDG